jgi:membrane protein YqaA with SNARE-associated domain
VKDGPTASLAEPGRGWLWLAFAWGLAEATFFFIVPDVLTSRLVLQKPRAGFTACLCSLAGALLGGLLLFFLGRQPEMLPPLAVAIDWLPGISPALMEKARLGLEQHGPAALFTGVLAGIPYKLYATQSAAAGLGLGVFVVASTAARLLRFLLVTALAWFVGTKLLPNLSAAIKLRIHLGSWIVFYFFYFWQMGL